MGVVLPFEIIPILGHGAVESMIQEAQAGFVYGAGLESYSGSCNNYKVLYRESLCETQSITQHPATHSPSPATHDASARRLRCCT